VTWWNVEVSLSSAASLECFVCHFGQYGLREMSTMNFLCELTMVILRLPWLVRMAEAVSSTVELINSRTSYLVNSFTFAMWTFGTKWFPIVLVPFSDGWRWTWSQTMHIHSRAAGLLNPAVQTKSPSRCMSRIIPCNRTFWAYIHWSPASIKEDLESKVAQTTNKHMFIVGRDHNL